MPPPKMQWQLRSRLDERSVPALFGLPSWVWALPCRYAISIFIYIECSKLRLTQQRREVDHKRD
jgi:hypothetical protein